MKLNLKLRRLIDIAVARRLARFLLHLAFRWRRTAFSVGVAVASLWAVAASQGLIGPNEWDDRRLLINVYAGPNLKSGDLRQSLYSEVRVRVELDTQAPLFYRALLGPSPYESHRGPEKGSVSLGWIGGGYTELEVLYWKDPEHKTQATLDGGPEMNSLSLQIGVNRELAKQSSREHPPITYDTKDVGLMSEGLPTPYEYIVSCPLSRFTENQKSRPLLYLCPLTFLRKTTPLKGSARFRWTQEVFAEIGTDTTISSTVFFDSEFDDVKSFDIGDGPAGVSYGDIISVAERTVPHAHKVGFAIEGYDSDRKDLVELLTFGMAALFGAAAASLFEQAATALRR